jgi:hypothetical protein
MFQPSTSEIGTETAQPERETVIKFVISGPFLNAEAAHTQWSTEPPDSSVLQDLLRRIADLERKLDEERALVEMLSHRLPSAAAAPRVADRPPLAEPAPARAAEPPAEPAPARAAAPLAAPAPLRTVEPVAAPAAMTIAAPPPPPLSTVARTPPPKVRGLRRMIGALRHL